MMIVKKSFVLYTSFYNAIKNLDDTTAGRLFKDIFEYHMLQKNPTALSERGAACFEMMQPIFDQNIESYQKRCERNKKNIQKRWQKPVDFTNQIVKYHTTGIPNDNGNENVNENDNKKKKSPKEAVFVKPAVDEIRAYCEARHNGIDAEQFYNFYEAKGWLLGKNKIKNWKCCVHTWERRQNAGKRQNLVEQDVDTWIASL